MLWSVTAVANLIAAVAYLAIMAAVLWPLAREGQWRSNRLGLAIAAIFFTCAIHHGWLGMRMALPGTGETASLALRSSVEPVELFWDVAIAGVALYYWSLRRSYGGLLRGASLFEDLRQRQRQALEINDTIVQGLVAAKLSLELDRTDVTREALQSTLGSARALITDLLGEVTSRTQFEPGDLRRNSHHAI